MEKRRKKMKIHILILFAALLGFAACSPNASSSINSSADNFRNYKTFAWQPPDIQTDNPKYSGEMVDTEIKGNVRSELQARGLQEVPENQNPDLLITYHIYTQNKQQISGGYYGGYYPGWGWGGYYGGWGYGGIGYYSPSVYNYTEGTLILDVKDARTNSMVWRGSIDGDVTNARKLDKRIDKGVHSIMEEFPIKEDGRIKVPS
jgi:hypothetical protein